MMNDTAIKNYAVWARRELVAEVGKRCLRYGIQLDADPAADIVDGRVLTVQERRQRTDLLRALKVEGYEQLVERAAYTWFNRLLAIRFMEVNDRLPSHVRVLSAPDGSFKPQALQEAMDLPIDALDTAKAADLVRAADDEALFRLVFLAQCAELAECMPAVFEPVGSDLELLLPTGLLRQGSVVERLVSSIPEEDWREDVEIVGWMYQYYVSERKDEVFASFKKGKKAERDAIAPATQLFTPDWIVQYLTQNSLGRLWMLNRPESSLTDHMRYYVHPDDTAEVEFKHIASPEEITVVDPACGSGHILVYAFELLAAMYEEAGYTNRDAARLILEKNLSGMEIDPRAASLASFALTMKACELDSRFLRRGVTPRITVLARVEFSNDELALCPNLAANKALVDAAAHLDECGSLLRVSAADMDALAQDAAVLAGDPASPARAAAPSLLGGAAAGKIERLRAELAPLAEAYDVVVANPPYMGSSSLDKWMGRWAKERYPESYRDLCTAFVDRGFSLAGDEGCSAMVTMQSWMFLGSFEKMRGRILREHAILSMAHLGTKAFGAIAGEVVSTTATVFSGRKGVERGAYFRLVDMGSEEEKRAGLSEALANPECGWFYRADAGRFGAIPGSPIAYWVGSRLIVSFSKGISIDDFSDLTGSQNITANNDLYLRKWWEVGRSNQKWIPYAKGGNFRRWYGNNEFVIDWSEAARNFYRSNPTSNLLSNRYWFQEGVTYSDITSGRSHFRYLPAWGVFDKKGPEICGLKNKLMHTLAFLNSSLCQKYLDLLNPSMTLQIADVKNVPFKREIFEIPRIEELAKICVANSKGDYDSLELSWDFKRHPLA